MQPRLLALLVLAFFLTPLLQPLRAAEAVSSIIWKFETGSQIKSSPAIGFDPEASTSLEGINIFFGTDDADGTFYALKPGVNTSEAQRVRWKKTTGRAFGYSSPTVGPDGTVYVATASVYAFAPGNGALRGQFQFPNGASAALNSSPAIGTNGDLYVGSTDGKFYALKRTGNAFTTSWSIALGAPPNAATIASSPSVTADGTIYLVTDYDLLVALKPDGTRKWERDLGGVYQPGEIASSPAIGRDGSIFIGSRNARLSAITDNVTNSAILWQYVAPSATLPPWFVSSPIAGFQGIIYAGGTDGYLYALNTSGTNVSLRYRKELKLNPTRGGLIRSTPAIDNQGNVWVGSVDGVLYSVGFENNDIKYAVTTGGSVHSSPVLAIDVDGKPVVYFGSSDGTFYALRGEDDLGSRVGAPWPMYRKDASHSGFGSANPPFISQQPASQTVQAGAPVTFTVVAGGNPSPTYQWYRNGTPISGNASALTATLSLGAASPNDNGVEFYVIVSNSQGSLNSAKAKLTVSNKPDIVANTPTFTMLEDTTSTPIPFTVFDAETPVDQLVVTGSSSDTRLLPNGNFLFGGTGANRTVVLKPATNQFGPATITLFVQDKDGLQNSATFTLTVTPVNDPPTLDPIDDVTVSEGGAGTTITVTGITPGQANELGQTLSLTAGSSNPGAVAVTSVVYQSPNPTGRVTLTPVAGGSGFALVTVTVTDNGGRANGGTDTITRSFTASVTAINDPPTITVPGPQTLVEDTGQTVQGVKLSDPDAGNGQIRLVISATNGIVGFGLPGGVTFSNNVSQGSTVAMTGTLVNMNKLLESLAYSANKEYSGPDTISFAVDDQGNTGLGGSKTATASIPITVIPVNDPPRIVGIPPEVTIKSAISFVDFTLEDPDSPLASINLSVSSSKPEIVPVSKLTFSGTGASRRLRIDPGVNLSQDGLVITIVANDGNPQNGIGTVGFLLRILANNAAPVLQGLVTTLSMPEDSSRTVTFTVGDAETPAASLGVSAVSSNPALVPNLAANLGLGQDGSGTVRTLVITPAANQFGAADIVVTVTDGTSPVSQTIKLTVTPVPDPPVIGPIQDVTVFTTSGAASVVPFTAYDGDDASADSLAFSFTSSDPSLVSSAPVPFIGGSGTNRTLRFAPTAGKFGSTVITLTARDPDGLTASQFFRFTVQDPSPFIITQPAPQTVAVGGLATFTVVAGGSGPLTYQWRNTAGLISGATSATLTLTGVQTGQTGDYVVVVSNGFGSVASAPARLNVLPLPVINTQPSSVTVNVGRTASFQVVASGGSPLSYQWRRDGFPILGATNSSYVITNVQVNQEGRYSVAVSNPVGSVTSVEAILEVEANTPPAISPITDKSTIENTPLAGISFSISDGETLPFALTVTAASTNPDLVPVANIVFSAATGPFRTFSITPAPGKFGVTDITITVSDGTLTTSTTFKLTVIKGNTPPTISDIKDVSLAEGSSTNLVFNVGDAETALASLVVTTSSSNPALVPVTGLGVNGSSSFRTLRITPATGQSGTAIITVRVSDGTLDVTDSFVLTVIKASTPPTISDIRDLTLVEGGTTNLVFSVSDAETAANLLVVTPTSSNPTLLPAAGLVASGTSSFRTLRITPAAGQNGTATITVKVNDGTLETADTFILTVIRANTPPTISNIPDLTIPESTTTNLSFTVGDTETPASSLSVTASSSNPALVTPTGLGLTGAGIFRGLTITPVAGQSGTATIVVKVSDGTLEASDQFTLTVPKANTPPVITTQPRNQSVNESDNVTFTVDVTGTAPIGYQWRYNGTPLATATNATLVLTNVQVTQAGRYTVVVSNVVASATSAEAVLTVTPINHPPTVSIATPAHGSQFGSIAVTLGAAANDSDGFVSKVEFFMNGNKVGEDLSSPFSFQTARLTPGDYTVTARATDNGGATAVSLPVTFKVIAQNNLPNIRIEDGNVFEGDAGITKMTFQLTLSAASASEVTVNYSTQDGTAVAGKDYVGATNRTVSFPPGRTTAEISVDITGDRLTDASNEILFVNLSNPVNANLAINQAFGTITDDDFPIIMTITDQSVRHGFSGTTNMVFEVFLSDTNGQPVTVSFATVDGSAKAGVDFVATSGVLVFPPGTFRQTITVTILGSGVEGSRTFTLKLSDPSNADFGDPPDDFGTGTIIREFVPPTVFAEPVTINERDVGTTVATFLVSLTSVAPQDVTVDYATADGTAVADPGVFGGGDYVPASGKVTIKQGSTSQTVTVEINGDFLNERDETFLLKLSNATGGAKLGQTQVVATIVNDDPVPSLTVNNGSRQEGNAGTNNMSFTARLNAPSALTVSVNYTTADDAAIAGLDYVATSGVLVFPAGVTDKTITVGIIGDQLFEGAEIFFLNLTNPTNATLSRTQAPGLIINDDTAPALSIANTSVVEGNSGNTSARFVVSLLPAAGQVVTVDYATGDGTATIVDGDYVNTSGRLTFAVGETSKEILVPVRGDSVNEPDETFLVVLSGAANASLDRAQAIGTITNDDAFPSVNVAKTAVTEADFDEVAAIFTVSLSSASSQTVTVAYTTEDGTATTNSAALGGADYQAASGILTFPAGITSLVVPIQVMGDLTLEADETFSLRLSNPSAGVLLGNALGTATIINNDPLPSLTVNNGSRQEGNSGTNSMSFSARLNAASALPVSLDYETADDGAKAGTDYVTTRGRLVFAPGVTTATISVPIIGDTVFESSETFFLSLSNPTNATLPRVQIPGLIINDDVASSPPVISNINEIKLFKDSTLSVKFTIADADTPLNQLVLTTSSGNPALLSNASLTIAPGVDGDRFIRIAPAAGQTGIARVTITVSDGTNLATEEFTVTVSAPDSPPVIVSQPQGRVVLAGTTVDLTVGVTGAEPLVYQWSRNGTNIAGANAATLTLQNIQPAQSGKYRVAITNAAGQALSNEAIVLVGQIGSKLWDVTTGDTIRSSPAIGPDGTIYIGSDDRKLYAVTPLGVLKWTYTAGAEIYSSPAVAADGTIYVGSRDFKLHAVRPDGTKKWEYLTGNAVDSSPAIAADGTIYVGAYDNKLHAVRPDGTKKWEFAVGGVIYSSPAIGSDGTIYVGSDDRKLHALTPAGTQKWEFLAGAEIVASPALGADGTIYFGSLDKKLYAVTPAGAERWSFVAGSAIRSSAALAPDGTVYFGADDGRVFALNPAGSRMWAFTTGLLILGSPAVGADGTVYVTSFDQRVYALNANGTKRWEYVTEGPIGSSPALDAAGVVYLGGFDRKIYAIKGTTGLADSAWPVFHRDNAHTGRAPAGAVTAPDITNVEALANGQIQLRVSVQAGKSYVIQSSSDLVTWTDLSTFTAGSETQTFTDPATGLRFRFYRVVAR